MFHYVLKTHYENYLCSSETSGTRAHPQKKYTKLMLSELIKKRIAKVERQLLFHKI